MMYNFGGLLPILHDIVNHDRERELNSGVI